MRNKKNTLPMSRAQEIEASKHFGKHMDRSKIILCFIAAFMMAMLPSLAGLSHWEDIPLIVETGIVNAQGEDDSMPRWAMVYLLPGLFALCTAICHGQLYVHQMRMKVPPKQIRLLGRWSLPVVSLFFCTWAEFSAAGDEFTVPLIMQCALGAALVLMGAGLYDCKKDALLSIPFAFANRNEAVRKSVHRLCGICWIVAGFAVLLPVMLYSRAAGLTSLAAAALVILPVGGAYLRYK